MKIYSFEKLECWQQARQLAVWTNNATKALTSKPLNNAKPLNQL